MTRAPSSPSRAKLSQLFKIKFNTYKNMGEFNTYKNMGDTQGPATMLPPVLLNKSIQFLYEFRSIMEGVQLAAGNGELSTHKLAWIHIYGNS